MMNVSRAAFNIAYAGAGKKNVFTYAHSSNPKIIAMGFENNNSLVIHALESEKQLGHAIARRLLLPDHLWMPIDHAKLLVQRIFQLSKFNFRIKESLAENSFDRLKKCNLEDGLTQRLYTHRVPGILYGPQKSIIYLSLVDLQFSQVRQRSRGIDKTKLEKPLPTQLFISQHVLNPNKYEVWWPSLNTIQLSIRNSNDLLQELGQLLNSIMAKQPEKPKEELDNKQKSMLQFYTSSNWQDLSPTNIEPALKSKLDSFLRDLPPTYTSFQNNVNHVQSASPSMPLDMPQRQISYSTFNQDLQNRSNIFDKKIKDAQSIVHFVGNQQ